MDLLENYKVREQLKISGERIVYRGMRKSDNTSVIIKTLKADLPSVAEKASLLHEYEIVKNMKIEGIVKIHTLERGKNNLALIMEDFGGESLDRLLSRKKLELKEVLEIAIQLASSVEKIHESNIIHKDIKPANIIINPETLQVKITDFGIATRLTRETHSFKKNLQREDKDYELKGTLAYISPEQTGRMNRAIDYRTDFYSLGVTFYEMLTGSLPFTSSDPIELIHCHLAVKPTSIQEINLEIPAAISSIVMKLLAKNAEDRYQSAFGLKADLETCLTQLLDTGKIANFLPGEMEQYDRFIISQKLYGRDSELATLLAAFTRVSYGSSEIVLVKGSSGIGKTSLIDEIQKPIVKQRGYFISGKFERFKKNIPYKAVIEAFQLLIKQLLTESSDRIAYWQEKLESNLGENAAIIIEVIPEVELIIGSQPAAIELGAVESRNRFNLVFQKFIEVFATVEHPLVLFLDDLQWADSASLELIELSLRERQNNKSLLIIGAYRDNEVTSTHGLMKTVEKIELTEAIVNKIALQALEIEHICELLADTVRCKFTKLERCKTEIYRPLAELIFAKTAGNPFLINMLLQTLYSRKLLRFDPGSGCWQWDIQEIEKVEIVNNNAIELVTEKLQKLPRETQSLLKLAACIGYKFELDILAIVYQKSQSKTATDLWPALEAGLILPLSDAYKIPLVSDSHSEKIQYKFLHDRVQQAAYSALEETEKKQSHLKIGRILLDNTDAEELQENIFDIVNQLNISRELIVERSERDRLASLNLIAGKKAKAAAAYQACLKYLNIGLKLLTVNSWRDRYELTLALHTETVAAEYLNANFARAEKLSNLVIKRAKTLLDKVNVYQTKIDYYIAQSKMDLAIDTALPILKQLGIDLPKKPNKLQIFLGLLETKFTQFIRGKRSIEALVSLPKMSDRNKLAAMGILEAVMPAAFIARPNLFPLAILKMINLSLKYGNATCSTMGYNGYGLIHCAMLGDIDSGYRYGKLGLNLLEKLNAKDRKAQTYLVLNNYLRHWKENIRETIEPLEQGIQSGLETGSIEDACYCATYYCGYLFLSGEALPPVHHKQVEYIEMMEKHKQEVQINHAKVWGQVVVNLLMVSENPSRLVGELFNEATMLPSLIKVNNNQVVFATYLAKSLLCYLFKDYTESANNAILAEKYQEGALGSAQIPVHKFYYSLALLALYPNAAKKEQKQYLSKVASFQKKMKHWAKHAPDNYLHKYQLVEAEKARVLGQNENASQYYDRAIASAKSAQYLQEEALANELAAEFYFSLNKANKASQYLMNAYSKYELWGAASKLKDLETRYPQFFSRIIPETSNLIEVGDETVAISKESCYQLDLSTVIKASLAISQEIVLDRLLSKLMEIMMENAGAQKGLLFLQQEDSMALASVAMVGVDRKIVIPDPTATEDLDWPVSLVNYIERTKELLIVDDADTKKIFSNDSYILKHQPQSMLGFPLICQGQLRGIIYLENRSLGGVFTSERLELLKILISQISISIENARLYKNLEHQAFHDTLTNLPNRRLLNHRLSQILTNAKKNNKEVAVIFLDLDRFKQINDSLGHVIGDRLLKAFATRLKDCLRQSDMVARWGGDEFTIVLPEIDNTEDVTKISKRILDSLKEPFELDNHKLYIKSSMGIAIYPHHGEDVLTLLKNADTALNQAKEKGKNRYQLYTQAIDSRAEYLLKLETSLHQAIDRQELFLHYQPQVNAKTGEIVGMEALLRWNHPELGMVSPGLFIPIAEENGSIVAIGEWVLRTACAQNKAWQNAGFPPIKISVNLSCRQFQQKDLVPMINQILAETELDPTWLQLEITESTIIQDRDLATIAMRDLQAIGVYLSMDDFGTGYSSLSYLKDFPFDSLKIDRAFVRGLGEDPRDSAILSAIISLAKGLNLQVVAEGVETQEQLQLLLDLNCDRMQGYFFSRPLKAEDATQFLINALIMQ